MTVKWLVLSVLGLSLVACSDAGDPSQSGAGGAGNGSATSAPAGAGNGSAGSASAASGSVSFAGSGQQPAGAGAGQDPAGGSASGGAGSASAGSASAESAGAGGHRAGAGGRGSAGAAGAGQNASGGSASAAGSQGSAGSGFAGQASSGGSAGVGTTSDPGVGGSDPGTTTDPAGGSAGTGTTEDPPAGGTTGDPPAGGTTGDPPEGGTTGDPPACIPSAMDDVNVIVFKDAAPSGADSLGGVYVGGEADFTANPYSIGTALEQDCDRYDLVVGGTLTGSAIVHNGLVAVDGDFSGSVDTICGYGSMPFEFADLEAELKRYSAEIALLEHNAQTIVEHGSITLRGSQPDAENRYIFEVDGAIFASSTQFAIDVPEPAAGEDYPTVIVNITGDEVIWRGGFQLPGGAATCLSGASTWCHNILYNLPTATVLRLEGPAVQGSVLAPFATLNSPDMGTGNVDGQVIVEYLYGNTEYHNYYFTGCLRLPWD